MAAVTPEDPRATFLLAFAEGLHRLGVPAHRLESALDELAGALAIEAQFLSTPTSIQAAFGPLGAQRTTLMRRSPGSTDLGRLARLDEVGQQVFQGALDPEEGTAAVEAILTDAGFSNIAVTPISHHLVFGAGLSIEEIVERLVNIGPIAQMVREAPEALQQPVREKVIAAVSPYYAQSTGMTLDGQFWQVTARS